MRFVIVSHRGARQVPEEQRAQNSSDWAVWMDNLNEQSGLRAQGGKTVSSNSIADYAGGLSRAVHHRGAFT